MWEYYLLVYITSIFKLLTLNFSSILKINILSLNHLYFSWVLLLLYFLLLSSLNVIYYAALTFINYKFFFYFFQNNILLKNYLSINEYFHFVFELLVGVVSIHPLLFYCSFFLLLFKLILKKKQNYTYYLSSYTVFCIILITFSLGSFWGWLNFSWGYMWVYDYIEYLLLLAALQILFYLHLKHYVCLSNINLLFYLNYFITYMLIRYSFVVTRHAGFVAITHFFIKFLVLMGNTIFFSLIKFWIIFFKTITWSYFFNIIFFTLNLYYIIYSFITLYLKLFYIHIIVFLLLFLNIFHLSNYIYMLKYLTTVGVFNLVSYNSYFILFNSYLVQQKFNYLKLKLFYFSIFNITELDVLQNIFFYNFYYQIFNDVVIYLIPLILLLTNDSNELFTTCKVF